MKFVSCFRHAHKWRSKYYTSDLYNCPPFHSTPENLCDRVGKLGSVVCKKILASFKTADIKYIPSSFVGLYFIAGSDIRLYIH